MIIANKGKITESYGEGKIQQRSHKTSRRYVPKIAHYQHSWRTVLLEIPIEITA